MHKRTHSFSVKNERGFTLVEILMALVILLILVVAFVPLFTYVAQAVSNNQAKDAATALANKTIEDLRSLPFVVLDSDTGGIEIDPAVPQLGIQGDSDCPGSIPAQQTITTNGKTYTINTDVDWDDNANKKYKKVSVSVEYLSAFNNLEVISNFYTISSEEGELKTSFTGNILVRILNKDGTLLDGAVVDVKITDPDGIELANASTVDGERLFEDLELGSYKVYAEVDGSLAYSPDQTPINGWLVLDKQVTSNNTTVAAFYFDHPATGFSLTLMGGNTSADTKIVGNATLQLSWTNGTTIKNFTPVSFGPGDFSNQMIPAATITDKLGSANLWPGGTYSIKLTDVLNQENYRTYDSYESPSPFQLAAGSPVNITVDYFKTGKSLLMVHLKSTNITYSSVTKLVSNMADLSGKGNPAATETIYMPSRQVYNEKQIVRFGNRDNITISSLPQYDDNFTIITVAKPDTGNKPRFLFYADRSSPNAGCRLSLSANGVFVYENSTEVAGYNQDFTSSFNVFAVKYQNKQPFLFVNGYQMASGPPSQNTKVFSPYTIGYNNRDQYFSGDVAEILIYDTALSNANIQLVTSRLRTMHGL